jgi:hypothetical protein
MQHIQKQNSKSNTEVSYTQELSYPKRIEIWSGRLAMVGFITTVAVMVLNAGY